MSGSIIALINLFLAVIWLALGAVLIARHWTHPGVGTLTIWGSDVSVGWFFIAMALYNVARWWSSRSYARRHDAQDAKERVEARRKTERVEAVDPNLSFGDDRSLPEK